MPKALESLENEGGRLAPVGRIYPFTLSPTDALKQVIAYCTSKGLPLIVDSDANAHHTIWGSSDINLRGSSLMEYLSSTELGLLNIGNRPTFMVHSHELTNWHVSDKESLSDHRYIFYEHVNVTSQTLRFSNPSWLTTGISLPI